MEISRRLKLGNLVLATRKARQISRNALAQKIGISYAYLANIEGGQRPLPDNLVEKLIEHLGLPIDQLMVLTRLSYIGDEASLETQELFTETFDQAVTQISGTLPDIVSKSHFKSLIESIEEDLSEYDPEYRERKDQATQKLLRSSESLSINEIELLTNIAKLIPRFREIQ